MKTLIEEWEAFSKEGEKAEHPVDEWLKARDIDEAELAEVCDQISEHVTSVALAAAAQAQDAGPLMQAQTVMVSLGFHFGFEVAAKRYGNKIKGVE